MADDRTFIMIGEDPEDWGFIPSFLDLDDPRPAVEQFNERYIAGWNKFEGFTFDPVNGTLSYPGDPPYHPISAMLFRKERIVLYPSAWVLIIQPDDTWQVARMD